MEIEQLSMTSLTEVYRGGRRETSPRRLYFGVGLFLVGTLLTVGGIVVGASSEVANWLGLGVYAARESAGVLAGVGLPVAFVGVLTVVPQTGPRRRGAGLAGALLALVGVGLFVWAYPETWYGLHPDYTLPVTAVYFAGALTSLWCVFTAVANFKTRNDPGGTVKLEITRGGATRVMEVSNERLRDHLGGIGLLGATPDGETDTQTNRPGNSAADTSRTESRATVSDGGATTVTDDGEVLTDSGPGAGRPRQDAYCGNCEHFQYVRSTDGDLRPYCGFHGEAMDDMDPCQRWEPNTG